MKKLKSFNFCTAMLCLLFILPANIFAQKETKKLRINGKEFTHVEREEASVLACPNSPWRTIDGTCNNQSYPSRVEWGATDIPLFRRVPADYGSPDEWNDMGGQTRPSPRAVSNACVSQIPDGESAANLSALVFTWGQFLDHDIDLTPEGTTEYEPIHLPIDEPLFTSDIHFFRSAPHSGTGINSPREQTNLITSWIDASNVYGSDEDRADWLRTFRNGKLKTSSGNLLPYNTTDGQYNSNIDPDAPSMAGATGTNKLFVAGDVRANEQPGLTALHTLFVREHNRICDELRARGLRNDEEMYQTARKWVGAYIQAITFEEFLPALGITLDNYNGYNSNVQPDISNVFATAAYRLGHTMVASEIVLKDNNCNDVGGGTLSLIDGFFNNETIQQYNISPILKGLSTQTQMEVDNYIVDELRNFLFGAPPNAFGLDLASLNIQRGRDHGLPDYQTVRQYYGLPAVRSFSNINPDPTVYTALANIYSSVEDMDVWVGMLAEAQLPGKSVGPTLHRILRDQFQRLRDGDAFFYRNDNWFRSTDKEAISNTRLATIIERNTDLNSLPENVLIAQPCVTRPPGGGNPGPRGPRRGNNLALDELNVYPNPAGELFNIELQTEGAETFEITIMDNQGRKVFEETSSSSDGYLSTSIQVGQLPTGIYSIRVLAADKLFNQKLIVE